MFSRRSKVLKILVVILWNCIYYCHCGSDKEDTSNSKYQQTPTTQHRTSIDIIDEKWLIKFIGKDCTPKLLREIINIDTNSISDDVLISKIEKNKVKYIKKCISYARLVIEEFSKRNDSDRLDFISFLDKYMNEKNYKQLIIGKNFDLFASFLDIKANKELKKLIKSRFSKRSSCLLGCLSDNPIESEVSQALKDGHSGVCWLTNNHFAKRGGLILTLLLRYFPNESISLIDDNEHAMRWYYLWLFCANIRQLT